MKKRIVKMLILGLSLIVLTGCGKTGETGSDSGQTADTGQDGRPASVQTPAVMEQEPPYDYNKVSSEYLIGYDYFTGDFLEMAPTVIAKVRYDGRVEVEFEHALSNGEMYTDVVYFDLSEEQMDNIRNGIDLKRLYELDPELPDPDDICDGGCCYLIIYGIDGSPYKVCGGFCPESKEFNNMRRVVNENLPEEFFAYCDQYKKAREREQNYDPYPLSGDPAFSDMYSTKYGVFLNYDGDLSALEDYNYIVIDAQYHTDKEIRDFKYSGYQKFVYSYINIGSLENFRSYYDNFSDLTLGRYENWDDEEWIDVSNEIWQDFILNELAPSLLAKGIDGFFVDNCDVYYNYPTDDILGGLAVIMKGLKDMGCEVIINGGDTFLNAYTERYGTWRDVITGINQECVFTGIDWDNNCLREAGEEDKEYFLEYIERYADQGAYIYLLEYAEDTQEANHIRYLIKEYCKEHSFLYYIADSIELS